ncbi:hypothetical protein PX554_07170 [Sphingomonas sp. H39-1-10]|uniref:hypothetical protein n=1 Tax=Sphingomonas pollutisoli TaxID=3030829 RepID=UPI0023B903F0|nr:hypothetical protein [Sphingomonas pollutisoli]MDF0487906.1 hypothetical protein [Sphingomonas pollutisoli]
MTSALQSLVAQELSVAVPREIRSVARVLAERLGGVAVLFYGSVLRTGALGDILDFYVLTPRARGSLLRRAVLGSLWPDVSYHEIRVGERTIRAKVATMPLSTFERAATGVLLDTTIWIRFAQPSALVWSHSPADQHRTLSAVAEAVKTAGRFAAVLGPRHGRAEDFWKALLRETYRVEFRVEPPGRETQILGHAPERYDRLLPLAWQESGIAFDIRGSSLVPSLGFGECRRLVQAWLTRAAAGKPLNVARLVKAAFTFDGAARYGLWKIERHTGVRVALTPWRERHPLLAAPGVLWRVFHVGGG